VLVILGCLGGLAYFVVRNLHGAPVGSFGNVEGAVTVTRKTVSVPAALHAEIWSDSTVVTEGAGSKASILFPDGGRVQVESDTSVGVGLTKRNALVHRGQWLRLDSGEVFAEIPEQSEKYPMRIATQRADGVLTRASFELAVTNNAVSLYVAEGAVNFTRRSNKKTVLVEGGSYAIADDNPFFEPRRMDGATRVSDFSVVDAASDLPIAGLSPLRSGMELDLTRLPGAFALRVDTEPSIVGSVKCFIRGPGGQMELILNEAPYIFRGQNAASDEGLQLPRGNYTFTAWTFSKRDGKGKRSAERTVEFRVKY
jgi:hypothetical protein